MSLSIAKRQFYRVCLLFFLPHVFLHLFLPFFIPAIIRVGVLTLPPDTVSMPYSGAPLSSIGLLLLLVSPPSVMPTLRLSQDSSRLLFCFWSLCQSWWFSIVFAFRSSLGALALSIQIRHVRVSWFFPGRVMRPLGPKRPLSPYKVPFQHLPPALASFSGFLESLSTSLSALGGSSANVFLPEGIAPPGIPYLAVHPTTGRCM